MREKVLDEREWRRRLEVSLEEVLEAMVMERGEEEGEEGEVERLCANKNLTPYSTRYLKTF